MGPLTAPAHSRHEGPNQQNRPRFWAGRGAGASGAAASLSALERCRAITEGAWQLVALTFTRGVEGVGLRSKPPLGAGAV